MCRAEITDTVYTKTMEKSVIIEKKVEVALLISDAGRWRDGLKALILANERIGRVELADDITSVSPEAALQTPALIFFGPEFQREDAWSTFVKIKTAYPDSRYVIFVENMKQQQQAISAGAHEVLFKEFSINKFKRVVNRLLAKPSETEME